jgi:hypothetical protein
MQMSETATSVAFGLLIQMLIPPASAWLTAT